jgi:acetyl esterase/lipase
MQKASLWQVSIAARMVQLALIATVTSALAVAAEPKPPEGFRAIFNGQDLSGWYGLNPHPASKLTGEQKLANHAQQRADFANHWKVEGGELVNNGTGPYATTDEEFGDIELRIEYQTVAGADSGVYLRGNPQVQIWDKNQPFDPKNPNRKPHQGSGGLLNNTPNTLGRDPVMVADKQLGQWNELNIRIIGARTWVTLNARLVVDGAIIESEAKQALAAPVLPNPTFYDVAYGPHPKQILHFWKAESNEPTPVLLFVHGGGWMGGGHFSGLSNMLPKLLSEGISVASVEYRFIAEATADGVVPPVKGPLLDAARALQAVRSKATEWNLDKKKIAASGGSAGACTSLWLAFHPDLADPQSDDLVARESSRLLCAAVTGAQTTLDPQQMKEWTPNSRYGGHAFGFAGDPSKQSSAFDEFLTKRDTILPWIAEYSPYALVSPDDPPVYLHYSQPPALGQPEKDPTHTANFGVKLQEHCRATGVQCELVYPEAAAIEHSSVLEYLLTMLHRHH